jgi:hypothetical protein
VQVDETHHDKCEGGRGQPGTPIVHAEILKEEHGAPVVEGRLLQPRMSIEIGGDAGAELFLEMVSRVKPDQHLMSDLCITGLVGANQPHAIATQEWSYSV